MKDISNKPILNENTEYFVQLIRIALADDVIKNEEMSLLYRIGFQLNFSQNEIKELIEATEKAFQIPTNELPKRFEKVYNLVKMTMIDGVIGKNQIRLVSNFAAQLGFKESEITDLLSLLITGIIKGSDNEDLFEIYMSIKKNNVSLLRLQNV